MKIKDKIREIQRKRQQKEVLASLPIALDKILFKEQLDFVTCKDKFARAVCSVRAGKSYGCAAHLISTAQSIPECACIYITLARSSAKRIVWPTLKRLLKQNKIAAELNNVELTATLENGSVIYLLGANTEEQMDKIRGLSRCALIYVDEAQLFRAHLKELVEDVLIKRLYDLDGQLRLIGTPPPVLVGYFIDVGTLPGWKQFHWTLHNNPWIQKQSGKTAEELIDQDCETRGCTRDDPSIQRECYGRLIQDLESLLLQYNPAINDYEELPAGMHNYILGIDLGSVDSNSLSVLSWKDTAATTWLVEEIVTSGQLIDQLASDIQKLMAKYPFSKMVVDAGGLGKMIVEDLISRYGFPLEAADKTGKMANYALLNNALRSGNFKAKSKSIFAQDCNILEKDRDKSTADKIIVKGHSDAIDSALYAFRFSPAYAWKAPLEKLKPGTPEYDKEFSEQMFNANMERLQREKQNREKPDSTSWDTDKDGLPSWLKWQD
jgi:terminase large subunit-like protein